MKDDLTAALQYIHSFERFGSKLGLERIRKLLEYLGNPEEDLKVVHVGGTNGKGSTSAMIASIVQAAGIDVGLYTSPYLERFNERIRFNGQEIPSEDIVELVGMIRPAVERMINEGFESPTEFEVVTALAFLYYKQKQPGLVVLEVGLGGRLDATNAIKSSLVSVITNVGLDHTDRLGPTVRDIAREKAGIVKQGSLLVTGVADGDALDEIKKACREQSADMILVRKSQVHDGDEMFEGPHLESSGSKGLKGSYVGQYVWTRRAFDDFGQVVDIRGCFGAHEGLKVPLLGAHQAANAALAVAAVDACARKGVQPRCGTWENAIRLGLERVKWPGRLEVVSRNPLILLDGAHNPDGVTALVEALRSTWPGRLFKIVIGILGDKLLEPMVRGLITVASSFIVTQPSNPRALDASTLARLISTWSDRRVDVAIEPDACRAAVKSIEQLAPTDSLLFTGSLYLISDVKRVLSGQAKVTTS